MFFVLFGGGGGAERVLLALSEIFPKAPIYSAFVNKNSPAYARFKGKRIVTSWAQNIPFFSTKLYSPLRFLAPKIWNSFDFSEYDVVVTSASWFVTKGVLKRVRETESKRVKDRERRPIEICYCHTPPRYLYGYATAGDIKRNFITRAYALLINHFMRVYDFEAAQRVSYFIANSHEVQGRIKKFYRRDSIVIYPPVDLGKFSRGPVTTFLPAPSINSGQAVLRVYPERSRRAVENPSSRATPREQDYFLVVSRLVASKNVDIVVEVCAKLGLSLKVVGTGREMENLKQIAKRLTTNAEKSTVNGQRSTVSFLGDVDDDQLIDLYQNCRAVIFAASQEDFGLVPVEAMAAGKPVIANAEGGVLESVIDASTSSAQVGQRKGRCTGVYFDPPTAGSLTLAINNFVDLEKKGYFDAKFIRRHAQKFSKERFRREIEAFVMNKLVLLKDKKGDHRKHGIN